MDKCSAAKQQLRSKKVAREKISKLFFAEITALLDSCCSFNTKKTKTLVFAECTLKSCHVATLCYAIFMCRIYFARKMHNPERQQQIRRRNAHTAAFSCVRGLYTFNISIYMYIYMHFYTFFLSKLTGASNGFAQQ